MTTFVVTLKGRTGTVERRVRARDEWDARQRALRLERGRGYWCHAVHTAP